MAALLQFTINGLIAGSIYALVASGFSLIYSTNRFMHLAHGATVAVGGYILFTLFSLLGWPFFASAFLTLIFTGIFGVGLFRFVYLPLQNKKASNVVLLIASIALLILVANSIQLIFGATVKSIGLITVSKGLNFYGAAITPLQIIIIGVSIVIFVALYVFMKKTKLGRNMRAVADNKELASVVGINQIRVADWSFFLGSVLAGIGGILIGLEQNIFPDMGTMLIIRGFTGAVVGGITSVPGAVVGSYLLGLIENYGIWFLPSGYKDAIAFLVLLIFLVFKPTGLFGLSKGVKQ
ncbi:MAG: branched-chain amino acid ABC transporter permease [Candidatus Woesearchaeota archaeon]|jgi:branched-chain amino acid transport system permease protein|nr:branched-chain amino acid ABC transporter permease [Candidatus Woesearchaeota archaeon]MDP7323564.1 branched-chain amino acid ABC transporter permease [Candidatus Woesearchaeota archaeon]MDP7457678.1 branched-chain amino acid ABC transporter permease [Candidatus Woesearchaeota archaeon]